MKTNLLDIMFGEPAVPPVETAESKAVGMLEDFYNNPYLVGRPIPKRLVVKHEGEYVCFNTAALAKKYGYE